MHAIQAFSVLALAGQALAFPGWPFGQGNWGGNGNWNNDNQGNADVVVVTATAYTTVYGNGNWGGRPTAKPEVEQPKPTTVVAKPSPSSNPGSGSGSQTGYMGIVSEYRSKMGLSALSQDSKLEGNAQKTAADGNGEMEHQLNPGTMGQVLAPGTPDEFEKVFVGGWLCEIPSLPGLDGVCDSMSKGWSYGGQTGHAEILSSTTYSKIGCACAGGIWSCDLA